MADNGNTEGYECYFVDGPARGRWWKVSRQYDVIEVPELQSVACQWCLEPNRAQPRSRKVYYRRIGTSNQFAVEHYGEWVTLAPDEGVITENQ